MTVTEQRPRVTDEELKGDKLDALLHDAEEFGNSSDLVDWITSVIQDLQDARRELAATRTMYEMADEFFAHFLHCLDDKTFPFAGKEVPAIQVAEEIKNRTEMGIYFIEQIVQLWIIKLLSKSGQERKDKRLELTAELTKYKRALRVGAEAYMVGLSRYKPSEQIIEEWLAEAEKEKDEEGKPHGKSEQ